MIVHGAGWCSSRGVPAWAAVVPTLRKKMKAGSFAKASIAHPLTRHVCWPAGGLDFQPFPGSGGCESLLTTCRCNSLSPSPLQARINQPVAWLKEVLGQVAVQVRSGPHKDEWELKKEYRTTARPADVQAAGST